MLIRCSYYNFWRPRLTWLLLTKCNKCFHFIDSHFDAWIFRPEFFSHYFSKKSLFAPFNDFIPFFISGSCNRLFSVLVSIWFLSLPMTVFNGFISPFISSFSGFARLFSHWRSFDIQASSVLPRGSWTVSGKIVISPHACCKWTKFSDNHL